MPLVCRNVPNRTKPRPFTAKDVRRIAKYAAEDGANAIEIFAGVAGVLGFGYVFCRAARYLDSLISLTNLVAKIGGILAVGRVVDWLLTVLSNGAFRRLPIVGRYLSVIVLALAFVQGAFKALQSIIDEASVIKDLSNTVHSLCSKVNDIVENVGENIIN
jgi:hypothetical protein